MITVHGIKQTVHYIDYIWRDLVQQLKICRSKYQLGILRGTLPKYIYIEPVHNLQRKSDTDVSKTNLTNAFCVQYQFKAYTPNERFSWDNFKIEIFFHERAVMQ